MVLFTARSVGGHGETAAETNWFNSTRPVRACELSRTSRITIIARNSHQLTQALSGTG